jgi:hypothetical protein
MNTFHRSLYIIYEYLAKNTQTNFHPGVIEILQTYNDEQIHAVKNCKNVFLCKCYGQESSKSLVNKNVCMLEGMCTYMYISLDQSDQQILGKK